MSTTWRNSGDERSLSMRELSDTFLKLKVEHEARFGKPLKAVKLSRKTLLLLPLLLTQEASSISTFYGVPIEVDDSLGFWEFEPVYA